MYGNIWAKTQRFKKRKKLGQIALAKEISVGKSVISLWENDECEPTLSKLISLSKFFNVPIDYLAGLEE